MTLLQAFLLGIAIGMTPLAIMLAGIMWLAATSDDGLPVSDEERRRCM